VLVVFHRISFSPSREWLEFLEALAGQAAIAIDSAQLFENLQRSNQQLAHAYNATIEGWSRALDLRDKETEGHTQRVTNMTLRLARSMGIFDEEELIQIRRGALLHDIGKMGVPDQILLKPDKLDEDERAVMKKHPVLAHQLIYPIAYLRKALDIPLYHHERWDGSGYPLGIREEQIPLPARIFSVIDVWDALRSDRPYRPGWTKERSIEYIQEVSGEHFDPQIVEAFLKMVEQEEIE
jgi:putative nucleotidyltransferase with HDIG domain